MNASSLQNAFNDSSRGIYVFAIPEYARTSAGNRALHFLCHALNMRGYPAYVTTAVTKPGWVTPCFDLVAIEYFNRKLLSPIVIYPETVTGNPLNANCIVRYFGNFKGLFKENTKVSESELIVSWAPGLNSDEREDLVLYIPTVDTSIFYPPGDPSQIRKGTALYREKYKYFHQGKAEHFDANSVEIRRTGARLQSQEEIAEIFRRAEVLYCYENSMMSLEAMLCGCPVVLIPNEFLDRPMGNEFCGMNGLAWGNEPEQVERAKATVSQVFSQHQAAVREFDVNLENFIELTQKHWRRRQGNPVLTPFGPDETFAVKGISRNLKVILLSCSLFLSRKGLAILAQAIPLILRGRLSTLTVLLKDALKVEYWTVKKNLRL